MANTTSFRANTSTPATNQPNSVMPTMPATMQIKTAAEKFFGQSGYNDSILNQISIVPNGTVNYNLINTGLVDKICMLFQGQIAYQNTATSAQTVSLSPEFPYSTISNINVVFNGQITLVNASAYEMLGLSAKRGKHIFAGSTPGLPFNQNSVKVSPKKASVYAGTNLTLNIGNGLTGYSSVTVAASSTGILNYQFVVEIPLTFRRDIPIGLLAMQNNSIICQVNVTAPALLGTSPLSPTFVAGSIPSTLALSTTTPNYLNATPVQYYWETPADKTSYAYFVANSYMYISVPGQSFKNTGTQALQYQMPNNYILTALLFTLRDANSILVDCYNNVNNPTLNYNNTTNVDRMPMQIREYLQEVLYEDSVTALGQVLWDACIHEYEGNNLSDSSFLNMYIANNPQFFIDIGNSVAVPGTFSIAREMIVPAQVKQA